MGPNGERHAGAPVCSLDGCGRAHYTRGLCELHYRRLLRAGDVRADEPPLGTAPPAECAAADCRLPAEARGWCHGHYQRVLRHGDVRAGRPLSRRTQPETCTVGGCTNPTHARGQCKTHSERDARHGDVLASVPVRSRRQLPRPRRCVADTCHEPVVRWGLCPTHLERQRRGGDVIDVDELLALTGKGSVHNGYRNVAVPHDMRSLTGGVTWTGLHRLLMALYLGRPLHPDEVVHHVNGDRSDNHLANLELWSTSHPKGQRVVDKVRWALEILRRYQPHLVTDEPRPATCRPSDQKRSPEEI